MEKLNRDNFYNGFAGEHYIISQFYRMKFEASKMEVDFGYDVLVTNQYRFAKNIDSLSKTKAIQVKTMTVFESDYVELEKQGIGVVCYAKKNFYISKTDFELISNMPNGFLVCLFVESINNNYHPQGLFWLSGKHLITARDNNYISIEKHPLYGECYKIIAQISLVPTINHLTDFCINRIEEMHESSEYLEDLKYLLSNSNVIPSIPLTDIDIVIPSESGRHFSYGTLKKELTRLENLASGNDYGLFNDIVEHYQSLNEKDSKINDVQSKKFEWELDQGHYDSM